MLKWYIKHLAEECKKKKKDGINTVYESIKISHMLIIKSLSLYFQNHQSKTKGHDQHVCVCEVHYNPFPWNNSIIALSLRISHTCLQTV